MVATAAGHFQTRQLRFEGYLRWSVVWIIFFQGGWGRLASAERRIGLWGVHNGEARSVHLPIEDGEVAHDGNMRLQTMMMKFRKFLDRPKFERKCSTSRFSIDELDAGWRQGSHLRRLRPFLSVSGLINIIRHSFRLLIA
jgi:hypothetical protein